LKSKGENKMNSPRLVLAFALILGLAVLPSPASAQSASGSASTDTTAAPSHSSTAKHATPGTTYVRPTERQKFHNYLFDSFGPYAFGEAAIGGGVTQATNSPPEWGQGMKGYGQRVASTFGIALVTTTTRYTLAEVLHEDTIYYRCECSGFFPRLGHAITSTVLSRRGDDGHYFISFPAIAAPYAGSMTAALGWYPARYNASDGFRMGNYNLATEAGKNVLLEFVYGGPHTVLGKILHKN
jgi:hypothetical protein